MAFSRHTSKDMPGYGKNMTDMRWNKEGTYLGMVCSDKSVRIGQLEKTGNFQNVHTIPNSQSVAQLCWNPIDDSRLAICGEDKHVDLWDVRASKASVRISTVGSNLSITWSYCGNYIAVGNRSDNIFVLDTRMNAQLGKKKHNREVNDLAFTHNSNYFLAASGGDGVGSLDIFQINGLAAHETDLAASGLVGGQTSSTVASSALAAMEIDSNSSSFLASSGGGSSSGGVSLEIVEHLPAHVAQCIQLRMDPTGTRAALGSIDMFVSLWDVKEMVVHHTIGTESEISAIGYSGDGQYLALADDNTLLISNADTAEPVVKIAGLRNQINCLSWHPKSNVIAAGVNDKSPTSPQYLKFYNFSS